MEKLNRGSVRFIRFAGVSFFVDEYWVDSQPERFDTLIYLKGDAKLSPNCDTSLEAVFASPVLFKWDLFKTDIQEFQEGGGV
jgi:hypothetical protein